MGFLWESHVSDPPRPDTKYVIFGARELGIQVKMIMGDHVAIAKETCRLIGIGTFDSHDQGHPSERGRHAVALSVSNFYFFYSSQSFSAVDVHGHLHFETVVGFLFQSHVLKSASS